LGSCVWETRRVDETPDAGGGGIVVIDFMSARLYREYLHNGVKVKVVYLDIDPYMVIVTPDDVTLYAVQTSELEVI
jgi:hypothetical protein